MGPFRWPDYEWIDQFEAEKRAHNRLTPIDRMMASLDATFRKIAAEQAAARRSAIAAQSKR